MPEGPGSSHRVLVTGAFGLVGSAVVTALSNAGYHVIATDLNVVAANQRRLDAIAAQPNVDVWWADLTKQSDVDRIMAASEPSAIVHLAAVIPPFCYARRDLARAVNVGATVNIVDAAKSLSPSPRFVLASSVAVYGARNPHREQEVLTAKTARRPCDLYGSHKCLAEDVVTGSGLEWVILRLGGVLTAEPRWSVDRDLVFFESVLPSDGRIHTVDVRDVADAFVAATTTERSGEVFLIGGDTSHRTTQNTITADAAEAMGIRGGLPSGRPGDPSDDHRWFATDWMDTSDAQGALGFQRHSLPDLHAQLKQKVGWRRFLMAVAAPLLRLYLKRRSPYRRFPGRYADPWAAIERRWGDPSPEGL